jgi:hypothetical protein
MMRSRMIPVVAVGIAFLFIAGYLGLRHFGNIIPDIAKIGVPALTVERAQKLFQEAGGIDTVYRDAKVLMARYNSKDPYPYFLKSEDLIDTPALLLLYLKCESYSGERYTGTSLRFERRGGSHLELKFGTHFSIQWIYIFDAHAPTTLDPSYKWKQFTPNIFLAN